MDNKDPLILKHTKLNRPTIPSNHLHRQHLLDRLDQHRHRPLTLVSAPADVVHPGIILSGDAEQMIDQKLALERRKKHKTVPPAAGDHPNRVPMTSVVVSGADRKSYLFKDGDIVNQKTITIAYPDQPLGTHVLVLKTLEGKHPTWSAVPIRHADSTAAVKATDNATLDRITFEAAFVEQALESMHPGMTLMITDLAAGPETRSERDFIIVRSEFVQS